MRAIPKGEGRPRTARRSQPEYRIWSDMVQRCTNPSHPQYLNYGARGITVCERWRSFDAFLGDVGKRPGPKTSLDRINNDLGYEPGNVRWATWREQTRNKRTNRYITAFGKTQILEDWAKDLGLSSDTLTYRLARWPLERALSQPPRRYS